MFLRNKDTQFEFSRKKSSFYFRNCYNLSKIHWCFLLDWLGCCNRQKSKSSCLGKSRCDLKIEFLQKCIFSPLSEKLVFHRVFCSWLLKSKFDEKSRATNRKNSWLSENIPSGNIPSDTNPFVNKQIPTKSKTFIIKEP